MSPILNNDMKTYIRHITLTASALLAALVLAASCARDERDLLPADMIPLADLELSWQVEDPAVYTKAGQSVLTENKVFFLYIMLFDGNGARIHSKTYYVGRTNPDQSRFDALINSYSDKSEEGGTSRGTIPEFFSGFNGLSEGLNEGLTFFAVANYSTELEHKLDAVNNISELRDVYLVDVDGNVSRQMFTMVAWETGVNINVSGGSVERVGVNLDMRRVDAKITFKVEFNIDGAIDGSVKFSNPIFKVHNIPDASYLVERSREDYQTWDFASTDPEEYYSCMLEDNSMRFDSTYTRKVGSDVSEYGGEFSFYLRENRRDPKVQITGTGDENWSSLYAMREAWEGGNSDQKTPVHGREFIYAPDYGTFVEFSGNLSYSSRTVNGNGEVETEEVNGYVTYIIHLGETGNDPNDAETVNNYDVRRNVRYIYNVHVTGINDYMVEVFEDAERRPGAEGDLIISTAKPIVFDAHYGRAVIELDRESLRNAGWSAATPLGTIKYDPETGLIGYPFDYKWVLFAINRHFPGENGQPTPDGQMVKFPGIHAYDGGVQFYNNGQVRSEQELREAIENDKGNDLDGKTFKEYIQGTDNYYSGKSGLHDDACLRDVNQLINYLHEHVDDQDLFNAQGKLYITAFCDEFTYIYDPSIEDYLHPGKSLSDPELGLTQQDIQRRLQLWKKYVNYENGRSISISPMSSTDVSPDGNSSITNAAISITQNSIRTIYDTDSANTELTRIWGLETTNETGVMVYDENNKMDYTPSSRFQNTDSDGRRNSMNFWIDDSGNSRFSWTYVMNVSQEVENADGINESFRDPFHACITRNRDLNGNNRIDAEEILWYLAAKDQLSGLWIGQPSLHEDAWMYKGDGTTYNHLVTSSYYIDDDKSYSWNNFEVLWAEEGAAWGQLRSDAEVKIGLNQYDYRCIRNLGIDINSQEDQSPSSYAELVGLTENGNWWESDYEKYYTIDVSNISPSARRFSSDNGFNLTPVDNERGINNRPYSKFDVLVKDRKVTRDDGGTANWKYMQELINEGGNPCPPGWRVPNQREFLILMSVLNGNRDFAWGDVPDSSPLGIATSFSFNGTGVYEPDDGKEAKRYGFMYAQGNLYLHNEGDDVKNIQVRCIRDNTN